MEDDFLETAILNWDNLEPHIDTSIHQIEPSTEIQATTFEPLALYVVLCLLALLMFLKHFYWRRLNE